VVAYATARNPLAYKTETRGWKELNNDGTVLNADGTVQYAEIGAALNQNFGVDLGTPADPNLPRTYSWEETAVIEHQVRPAFGVAVGYYHRKYYNLTWTQNRAVNPNQDYTPFTIVGPSDPRLPKGGSEVITLYNLKPSKLGLVDNLLTVSTTNTQVYDGFEVSTNARLKGAFFFGGVTVERYTAPGSGLVGIASSTSSNLCQVPNPNQLRFCNIVPPFRPLFKFSGMVPLPYGVQIAGNFQVRPGPPVSSLYTVTSQVAGIPLVGVPSLAVQLIEPNTVLLDYQKQADLRISKKLIRQVRVLLDVYNAFNSGTVTQANPTWGPNWLRPQAVLNGRSLRFGGELNF
jgi:hypothetical protein